MSQAYRKRLFSRATTSQVFDTARIFEITPPNIHVMVFLLL